MTEVAYERELRSRLKHAVLHRGDDTGKALCRLVKLLDERLGKQGQTIHRLRAELAETRELHLKVERGDIRRLEHENVTLLAVQEDLRDENRRLREKLQAHEG